MGTDIHITFERKGQNWECINDWIDVDLLSRDYCLFAVLADMRNYDNLPYLAYYQNLDKYNITEKAKEMLDYWDYDGGYIATLKELYTFYCKLPQLQITRMITEEAYKNWTEQGIKPTEWATYMSNGIECTFDIDNPMEYFLQNYIRCCLKSLGKILLEDDLKTKYVKEMIDEYGDQFRIIFCFDN